MNRKFARDFANMKQPAGLFLREIDLSVMLVYPSAMAAFPHSASV